VRPDWEQAIHRGDREALEQLLRVDCDMARTWGGARIDPEGANGADRLPHVGRAQANGRFRQAP